MSRMKRSAEAAGLLEGFRADGATFDPEQDGARLGKQAQRVWDFMAFRYGGCGQWWSLAEIAGCTGFPESSISARLRDFRKARFGSHTVERRRRKDGKGTWEYRLRVNGDDRV